MKLTIDMEQQTVKVSEMRRRLAKILSKLAGDQEVRFDFHAVLLKAKITSKA